MTAPPPAQPLSPQQTELTTLRSEIDRIDAALVHLLAERQGIVEKVIVVKQRNGLPARINDRVDEVIANAEKLALENGLHPDLARKLWTEMVEWFIAYEGKKLHSKP